MGCTASKIERAEEATLPAASSVQQKIEQIARRSWWRKGSTSASRLLRPVDLEDDLPVSEPPTPMKEQSPRAENENLHPTEQPKKGEETRNRYEEEEKDSAAAESKILEMEEANVAKLSLEGVQDTNGAKPCSEAVNLCHSVAEEEANGAKLSSIASKDEEVPSKDEEMPGSPSFRFYFLEALHDSDDEDFTAGLIKKEETKTKMANTKKDQPQPQPRPPPLGRQDSNESTTSSEESEAKRVNKAKAKRFRGLTRAPSAVIRSFLNVRNCYSNQSAAAAANGHENKQLIRVSPVVV